MSNEIKKKDGSIITLIILLLSVIATILFLNTMYHVIEGRDGAINKLIDSNVKIYTAGLLLFCFLFTGLEIATREFGKNVYVCARIVENSTTKLNQFYQWCISMIPVMVGFSAYIHWGFVDQWNEVGVSNGTFFEFPILFRIILTLISGTVIAGMIFKERDISKLLLFAIYCFSVLITIMQIYTNPFAPLREQDFTMAIYDNTSITESIYNVYDLVPFDYASSSLYGHYGLFFLIPLRILGTARPEYVIGLLACAGSIAQIAANYIINKFAPKRWIAGLLCLASVIRTSYGYMAISPIRTTWPLIMSAFLVFIIKHERYNRQLEKKGYLISLLACLWNTETGIACTFGFAVYLFFIRYREIGKRISLCEKLLFFIKNIFLLLFETVLPLICAVVVVNIYNLCCGKSSLIFRVFFYPFDVKSFIGGTIKCNPPMGNHAWVYIVALLLSMIAWGLKAEWTSVEKRNGSERENALCAMCIACIGAVAFAYYMNEAHWGCMDIVHQLCFGLIAIIIGRSYCFALKNSGQLTELLYRSVLILSIAVALSLALNVYNDPVRFASKHQVGAYSFERFHQEAKNIKKEIPENTYGIGQGISILYHDIGWDNHLKLRDTSALTIDQTGQVFNLAVEEVLMHDTFLITNSYYDHLILNAVIKQNPEYKRIETVVVNGWDFWLYSRTL